MIAMKIRYASLTTKEVALISVFAAMWIAVQITLGPIIGRFSLGPVSFHGVVNRVFGWMLMLILADISDVFGRVSTMSLIAAIGTRIIRLSPLTGLITGLGYALGGFIFDVFFFVPPADDPKTSSRRLYLLASSAISGFLAITPYLIFRLYVMGVTAFIALTPIYAVSTVKGVLFSIAGTSLGLSILPRLDYVLKEKASSGRIIERARTR